MNMNKPTIQIKPYTHAGNYVITTANAVGAVKSILIELSPSFYPNGNRAYPSIRTDVLGFNEQLEAIAGWCHRALSTATDIEGDKNEKRRSKVLEKCIALLSKQPTNRGVVGFNVSRRRRDA